MTGSWVSSAVYVDALRARIRGALAPIVGGRRVVLLDAAAYANVGDCAITVGTLTALAELGAQVDHVADHRHFDPRALGRTLTSDTVILLQGGGNVGDLYPRNQSFRERIIESYADHRIVQLPQSVHYEDDRSAEGLARRLERHGGVTVMLRDAASVAVGRELLGVDAALVPDMAFALGRRSRAESSPEVGVLLVLRRDREDIRVATPIGAVDWPDDRRLARRSPGFGTRLVLERATRSGPWRSTRVADELGRRQLVPLATQRVRSGLRWLGHADRIVSDRLHVHVLATLLGIPHVIVESRTGKVTSFMDTWPGLAESFAARSAGTSVPEIERALGRLRTPDRTEVAP